MRRRLKQGFALGLAPWILALTASAPLLIIHPFKGALDRGSILSIAGLVLAIVAVTVGLVAVLAQHLAETYARSLLDALFKQSTWRTASIAEGVGVVALVGLALWRPDLTAGLVATIVLVAALFASWTALRQLLRQFDPLGLIKLEKEVAIDRLQGKTEKANAALQPSQAILSLIVRAAAKGDTEVVAAGMAAWNTILERYMSTTSIVWYDEYLYWLYPRCEELIEQHAKESVGLILPSIVEGVTALGVTTAGQRNTLNANFDEGTFLFIEALKNVVRLAGLAKRSPAGQMAAKGATDIGMACLTTGKFAVLQAPIDALTQIGKATTTSAIDVSGRAGIGLANLVLQLAQVRTFDVMCRADAEEAVGALCQIVAQPGTGLGTAHYLVAQLSDVSLPLLVQVLARAEDMDDGTPARRRRWDSLASTMADLCLRIADDPNVDQFVRSNALDAAGGIVLALLSVEHRESILEIVQRICAWATDLTLTNKGREGTPTLLAVLCLATYCASDPPADNALRAVSLQVADRVAKADSKTRVRLSPILRQIGATALHYEDTGMAEVMAGATLSRPPTPLGPGRVLGPELFEVGGGYRLFPQIARPGVDVSPLPAFHKDQSLQAKFLELEEHIRSSEK